MLDSQEVLQLSHAIVYEADFIAFYVDNPFTEAILWQITWNEHKAIAYKNTLLNSESPYRIRREEGEINLSALLKVASKIRQIALPAHLDCAQYGRDGHFYNLTIGDRFTRLAYEWYEVFVPDVWESLNEIAKDLKNFLATWAGKDTSHWQLAYTEEETSKGFATFIEITKEY